MSGASPANVATDPYAKEKLEHRLAIIRIIIEKLLLGGVVALLAFLASLVCESFKSGLTERRFLLEKRLEGIQQMSASYSQLADLAYECGVADDPVGQELLDRYSRALSEFNRATNQWNVVFDEDFAKIMSYHVSIHDGIATGKVHVKREHWAFLTAVFENFAMTAHTALGVGARGDSPPSHFVFQDIPPAKRDIMPGHVFFAIQYKKWQSEQ
jgi:hypothetical protein